MPLMRSGPLFRIRDSSSQEQTHHLNIRKGLAQDSLYCLEVCSGCQNIVNHGNLGWRWLDQRIVNGIVLIKFTRSGAIWRDVSALGALQLKNKFSHVSPWPEYPKHLTHTIIIEWVGNDPAR